MNIKYDIINKFSYALCLVSGIILSVAFTFRNAWWLCFIGLVPLMLVILGTKYNAHRLVRYIFTFSLGYYVPLMMWIFEISAILPISKGFAYFLLTIGIILIGLLQGTYLALATIVFPKIKSGGFRDIIFFSALFVLGEFFQEYTPLIAFPWANIAVIATDFTPFIQSASLFGGLFISFLIIFMNGCIAYKILHFRERRKVIFAFAVMLIVFLSNTAYGYVRINLEKPRDGFDALVVQGNHSGLNKWSTTTETMFDEYVSLTKKGATPGTKLVVWPETAIPTDFFSHPELQKELVNLAQELDTTLLVGFFINEGGDQSYNSMIAVSPSGEISKPYHKQILAPFGEYFPLGNFFKKLLPMLSEVIDNSSGVLKGEAAEVIDTPLAKIGGIICYESIFSRVSRDSVKGGAEILAIGSNDSWFGETSALYQHYSHAIMRAVETKRFVLRASNTGISAIISPFGEVKSYAAPFVATYSSADVNLISERTLYSKIGDIIIIPCVIIFLFGFSKKIINKKRKN